MSEINFAEMIANGLKKHCEYWGHDHIESLRKNNSIHNFYKLFCKVTSTYYVDDGIGYIDFSDNVTHYNVTFNKKENIATVKRCGKDFDERGYDAVINIEDIIKLLTAQNSKEGQITMF